MNGYLIIYQVQMLALSFIKLNFVSIQGFKEAYVYSIKHFLIKTKHYFKELWELILCYQTAMNFFFDEYLQNQSNYKIYFQDSQWLLLFIFCKVTLKIIFSYVKMEQALHHLDILNHFIFYQGYNWSSYVSQKVFLHKLRFIQVNFYFRKLFLNPFIFILYFSLITNSNII